MKWSITACQLRTNDQVFLSCISSGNCFATSFSSLPTSHIIQKQISQTYFTLISSNNFCTTTCAMSSNGNFIHTWSKIIHWNRSQDVIVRFLTSIAPFVHWCIVFPSQLIVGSLISYTITFLYTLPTCAVVDVVTRFRAADPIGSITFTT